MTEVVFARANLLFPRVIRRDGALRLEMIGGADALHDPRTFELPIAEAHAAAIRESFGRHLLLRSALLPLCEAAGIGGPIDEAAATALLDPILLSGAAGADACLARAPWSRAVLVAHGADTARLDEGRMVEAVRTAGIEADWARAREDDADRRRAERGVVLAPLDAALLRFTGQYVHGATVPRRDPSAVDPELLPEVLGVVATVEQAVAGMRIARDPRRGPRGTAARDWKRMQGAAEAALRTARPELVEDAVRTVGFLVCAEAADRGRRDPYDVEARAAGAEPARALTFSDDRDDEERWAPGNGPGAVEAFWAFVAERYGSGNDVFVLEDEAAGDGIQLMLSADAIARVRTVTAETPGTPAAYRVEYGLVDGLPGYREMVRAYVAGAFTALDGLARWTSDPAELEDWRQRASGSRQ
ncbi:DUF6357 family protein [Leucobacter allii]|uniref:DUF6357 family protein n=1 Tax=Leucobacter allii TaxID=2932247 RepID=A0ABY4FHP5_9MICO|nr:DUF6357 family protein [Leucobacter allii]UOQ56213.1 DUF6357 family protein [Leucobacter allii]